MLSIIPNRIQHDNIGWERRGERGVYIICPFCHNNNGVGMDFKHGVIIGRFNPPHRGHAFLIDIAVRCSRAVTLFLCSTPTERIPGTLRVEWVQRMFPMVRMVHIATPDGAAARGGVRAVEIWANAIRDALTAPADALFASEPYGEELADRIGAAFVCVDDKRTIVPISGDALRSAPFSHWCYLPELVRPYFVLPIVVDAPPPAEEECSGSLADMIGGSVFSPPFAPADHPELARHYLHAQLRIAYRCLVICNSMAGAVDLLPRTYHTPLRVTVVRLRYRWRIAFSDKRNTSMYHTRRLVPLLARVVEQYFQKDGD